LADLLLIRPHQVAAERRPRTEDPMGLRMATGALAE
jgi:hypothetical protein